MINCSVQLLDNFLILLIFEGRTCEILTIGQCHNPPLLKFESKLSLLFAEVLYFLSESQNP